MAWINYYDEQSGENKQFWQDDNPNQYSQYQTPGNQWGIEQGNPWDIITFPDGSTGTRMMNAGNDLDGNPQWVPWGGNVNGGPGSPGMFAEQMRVNPGDAEGFFDKILPTVVPGILSSAFGAGLGSLTGLTGNALTGASGYLSGTGAQAAQGMLGNATMQLAQNGSLDPTSLALSGLSPYVGSAVGDLTGLSGSVGGAVNTGLSNAALQLLATGNINPSQALQAGLGNYGFSNLFPSNGYTGSSVEDPYTGLTGPTQPTTPVYGQSFAGMENLTPEQQTVFNNWNSNRVDVDGNGIVNMADALATVQTPAQTGWTAPVYTALNPTSYTQDQIDGGYEGGGYVGGGDGDVGYTYTAQQQINHVSTSSSGNWDSVVANLMSDTGKSRSVIEQSISAWASEQEGGVGNLESFAESGGYPILRQVVDAYAPAVEAQSAAVTVTPVNDNTNINTGTGILAAQDRQDADIAIGTTNANGEKWDGFKWVAAGVLGETGTGTTTGTGATTGTSTNTGTNTGTTTQVISGGDTSGGGDFVDDRYTGTTETTNTAKPADGTVVNGKKYNASTDTWSDVTTTETRTTPVRVQGQVNPDAWWQTWDETTGGWKDTFSNGQVNEQGQVWDNTTNAWTEPTEGAIWGNKVFANGTWNDPGVKIGNRTWDGTKWNVDASGGGDGGVVNDGTVGGGNTASYDGSDIPADWPSWLKPLITAAGGITKFFSDNPWAAGLLGAGLGGLSGNQQTGTHTIVQDIPEWLKTYLNPLIARGQANFNAQTIGDSDGAGNRWNGTAYEPEATFLARYPEGQAPNRMGLVDAASKQMEKVIGGDYLDPSTNPWLKSTYDQAAQKVTDSYKSTTQPRTDAFFNKAGAFGPQNSAWTETVARNNFGLGQNLNNLATDIYGGNYQRERDRQQSAITGAPAFTAARTAAQSAPYDQFRSMLSGWGGSQQTSPTYSNPLGSALNGFLSAYSASQLFKPK